VVLLVFIFRVRVVVFYCCTCIYIYVCVCVCVHAPLFGAVVVVVIVFFFVALLIYYMVCLFSALKRKSSSPAKLVSVNSRDRLDLDLIQREERADDSSAVLSVNNARVRAMVGCAGEEIIEEKEGEGVVHLRAGTLSGILEWFIARPEGRKVCACVYVYVCALVCCCCCCCFLNSLFSLSLPSCSCSSSE
jgi:hypothetical protein